MKIKVGFTELGKGDFLVAVPVVSWQAMVEVIRGVVDYLTILGDEIGPIEGNIVWVKRRPGLLKAIEISVIAVLRRLRKRKALEVLTTKTYHPQMKTFFIRTRNREEGLELREVLVGYIEDQLIEGIRVGEVGYQGAIEVTCSTDKMVRLTGSLQHCLSKKRGLLKAGALK